MMCQIIGRPPTSTIGLGLNSVSSRSRVPKPPASSTAFTIPPMICVNLGYCKVVLELIPCRFATTEIALDGRIT